MLSIVRSLSGVLSVAGLLLAGGSAAAQVTTDAPAAQTPTAEELAAANQEAAEKAVVNLPDVPAGYAIHVREQATPAGPVQLVLVSPAVPEANRAAITIVQMPEADMTDVRRRRGTDKGLFNGLLDSLRGAGFEALKADVADLGGELPIDRPIVSTIDVKNPAGEPVFAEVRMVCSARHGYQVQTLAFSQEEFRTFRELAAKVKPKPE